MLIKNLSRKIIKEAMCKVPPREIAYNKLKVNDIYANDGRELLLDDVTELLNEIYQTLVKDYHHLIKV